MRHDRENIGSARGLDPESKKRPIPMRPFLKWPGGKRWLVPHLLRLISDLDFKRYFEPFAGGAALFFSLRPRESFLSDVNADLINTYQQVRDRAPEIVRRLKRICVDRDTYYSIRAEDPFDGIDRAVRFLYLNRTAFGGIYRVNSQGRFNVPFGGGQRTPAILWERGLLTSAACALKGSELIVGDFAETLEGVRRGDLVYCDPTYTVSHSDNGFRRYNEANFRWKDQERLAEVCFDLRARGATVLVSNAAHESVRTVFRCDEIYAFSRNSTVSRRTEARRLVREELFVFRPTIRSR